MKAAERRKQILNALNEADAPLSATALANKLSVSRQSIVGDIALLRAHGHEIVATARGYVLDMDREENGYTITCRHTKDDMREELYAIVDQGAKVIDVSVQHAVYGELSGQLNLSSRYDVDQFIADVESDKAQPISALTGGLHSHHIHCPSEDTFRRVCESLKAMGVLVKTEENT